MKEIFSKRNLSVLVLVTISGFYFFGKSSKDNKGINPSLSDKDDVFSVTKVSTKTIKTLNQSISDKLKENQDQNEKSHLNQAQFHQALDKINEKLNLESKKLGRIIDPLELEHKKIITQMVEDGVYVTPIMKLSPKLKLVLSKSLLIKPSEIKIDDLNNSEYSSGDWRLLKLLANSTDLKVLLSNDELNYEFVNLKNLKRLYGQ